MEKINVVILSDDLDLRIEVKNLLQREQFAISGYSDYGAEAKTKIVNLFPEVVLCAVRGEVQDNVFTFVQDLLTTVRNSMVVLVNDNISVDLVNKAAGYGIRKACEKRPVSMQDIEALTSRIEKQAYASEQEITSEQIGEMVMEGLKSLDEVSYVRYASVYKQFKDIDSFMRELNSLLSSRTENDGAAKAEVHE